MIHFCIVLYNKLVIDSETYISLRQSLEQMEYSKALIYVFDNSTDENIRESNKKYALKKKIIYRTSNTNVGLSKAYNFLIDEIRENKDYENDYFVTFDDDTEIRNCYLQELIKVIENEEADVYLPVVYANGIIISPSNCLCYAKVLIVDNVSKINLNYVTGINTGLCIRITTFSKIRYNEELFLDNVDHSLFESIHRNNLKIFILKNSILYQKYSQFEKVSKNRKLERFRITLSDNKIYAKSSWIKKIFFRFSGMRQAKRLDKEYYTDSFMKLYKCVWKS